MAATCKCSNGHTWHARVIEDSPDINVIVVEPDQCPDCDAEEFEIIEVEYEHFDDDVI